ncbi:MAG: rhombosortase [Lentisphaeraceae bacterium]|nr:rhombosortase [Lentisphaeraceae bacterium]
MKTQHVHLGVPLICGGCMLLLYFLPQCQYDRQAIGDGTWILLFSGHFSHWDADHLMWDVLTFVLLVFLLMRENAKVFYQILFLGPWFISLFMWFGLPEMNYYRGISGIDAALFVALAMCYWQKEDKLLALLMLVCIFGKIIWEYSSQSSIFTNEVNYVVLPLAHVAGALCGWLFASNAAAKAAKLAHC